MYGVEACADKLVDPSSQGSACAMYAAAAAANREHEIHALEE